MDRNRDGAINGGTELFGQGTDLANGQKATNGYQALAELDTNKDGAIGSEDAKFSELMVWVDGNSDGVSDASELHSLSSLGITKLDLAAQTSTQTDNGNLVGLVSSYTTTDGTTHEMADVWFATKDQAAANLATTPQTEAAAKPIELTFVPLVDPNAPPVVKATVTDTTPVSDLRAQVGGLVDAMQAYGNSSTLPAQTDAPKLVTGSSSGGGAAQSSVLGMVDAMKQFDANGKPLLTATAAPAGAVPTTLNTGVNRKPDSDLLAPST
jgi:hypothetical protein